jgi:hypothetical protein
VAERQRQRHVVHRALDVDGVRVSSRKGAVVVRSGKHDAYREVPLNALVRATAAALLDAYLERANTAARMAQLA